jgi:hypothetical protein
MSVWQLYPPFSPAKAGIQNSKTSASVFRFWAPAFAGANGVLFFVFLAIASAVHAQQPAQATLKLGDIITGTLQVVNAKHPNGTAIRAYEIVSNAPKPFAKKDEFCGAKPPKTFQLIVTKNPALTQRLDRLVGKTIAVEAEDFFCAQTAWHIADAVLAQWRLKP